MKKQEFKKIEERLRNLPDNFKCSNILIIGEPEREEDEQEIENLFEKNNTGKLSQSGKGNNLQEVQEAQRFPKKLHPKRNTLRHIIIKLPKFKDKERILKATKGESYLQRCCHESLS